MRDEDNTPENWESKALVEERELEYMLPETPPSMEDLDRDLPLMDRNFLLDKKLKLLFLNEAWVLAIQ